MNVALNVKKAKLKKIVCSYYGDSKKVIGRFKRLFDNLR